MLFRSFSPTLAAWLHTLDPYAIELWDGGPIRWYGLSYLAGFALAFLLIRRVTTRGITTLPTAKAGDLVISLALGAVVGGRVGYVLFYKPELLTQFSGGFPWWGALDMMGGGMASHGGIIGTILAALWFAHRNHQPKMHTLDLLAFAAPLGLACGRLANFINGELIGRACDKDFPLAVQFPQEIHDWLPNPRNDWSAETALTKMPPVVEAVGADVEHWRMAIEAYPFPGAEGQVARDFVHRVNDRVFESLWEATPHTQAVTEALARVLPYRHPSQLYALLTEGVVVFAVLFFLWRKPQPIGLIGGAFGVAYGLMRIANEHFRLPDAHLGFQWLGLTRGQWLSVPLIFVGLLIIAVSLKAKHPLMGGWRQADVSQRARRHGDTEEDN